MNNSLPPRPGNDFEPLESDQERREVKLKELRDLIERAERLNPVNR